MKKQLLTLTALVAVLASGVTLVSAKAVQAQDSSSLTNIVQRIAQRFNLNEQDVQNVFDEMHNEHQTAMKEEAQTRLTEAVKNGTISQEQKNAILNKIEEMRAEKPDVASLKNMTPEQRRQTMQEKRSEMESWAQEQGLSLETFHELVGQGGARHHMHRMMEI